MRPVYLIGRNLHDGYAQSLAAVALRLERCRERIRRGRIDDVAEDLAELQRRVYGEFDSLRAYSRHLAALEPERASELAANVWRHASARHADIRARSADGDTRVRVEDDGGGFASDRPLPLPIRARVGSARWTPPDLLHGGARRMSDHSSSRTECTMLSPPIRIAIADDHALFRQGLRLLLQLQEGIDVVGETDRVDDIYGLLERSECEVLLLDLWMDRSSMSSIQRLSELTKVIVVTASEVPDHAAEALRAGAHGIVMKRFAAETLLEAIHAVLAGQIWAPPDLLKDLAAKVRRPDESVHTPREIEVVRHVALGLRNAGVARKLFISEQTVKAHLNNIFQKIGVRDRVELALYAVRTGVIIPGESVE